MKRADAKWMRKRRFFEAREHRIAAAVRASVLRFLAEEIDAQNLWWCPDEV